MQSLSLFNGDLTVFVTRPVAAGLLALSVAGVVLFAFAQRGGRQARPDEPARNAEV